jgi:hypothetical protein
MHQHRTGLQRRGGQHQPRIDRVNAPQHPPAGGQHGLRQPQRDKVLAVRFV